MYDHIILAPVLEDERHDFMRRGNQHDGASSCPAIIIELDSRQATDCVLQDLNEPDQCIDDDDANLNMTTALDFPPPCITLEMPHSTTNNRSDGYHRWQQNWEWKRSIDEDWIPIQSGWMLEQRESDQQHQIIQHEQCSDDADGSSARWQFPHQMDLCQVSTIFPVHQIMDTGIANKDEWIYDFGKDLLGMVHISIPAIVSASHQPTVLLRVGETLEEAMNDDEEYFEQCVDVCDCTLEHELAGRSCWSWSNPTALSVNDGCSNTQHRSLERSQDFISFHLLAFRYIRIIIPDSDHLNINVTCQVHSPFLYQRGSFSCDDSSGVKSKNPNVETRIWQTAAYTLQLCIHNNFIIDGKHEHNTDCSITCFHEKLI